MELRKRTYSLPAVTLERFEHTVPSGRRSGVIANMLQEWIDRRRREQLRREVIEGCRDMSAVHLDIEQAFHPLEKEEPATKLWLPDRDRIVTGGDSIDEVVKDYSVFLEVRHPDHFKVFRDRLKSAPEAAKAEAVVFTWLRSQKYQPLLAESLSTGGPDYLCLPESKGPFLIEVTHLDRDAVERRSGWPDELDDVVRAFSMITPNLWSKTRAKAPQLADQGVPRILAICLAHTGASVLLGTLAAEWLMISEPRMAVPIASDGSPAPAKVVRDLRKAAFFKPQDGMIVPVRQSISALLLIAMWKDQLEVVGLLHPAPVVPFDYRTLRGVPFLRVEWPVTEGALRTEWVVGHPTPNSRYYSSVIPTDAELKGE